mmetsp:Transcript_42018/g.65689  ORF Transcript_42018/g.65689 Transcript_42018/m.65689 type:complete len:127 (-) Transcript_42018:1240-1620(-)
MMKVMGMKAITPIEIHALNRKVLTSSRRTLHLMHCHVLSMLKMHHQLGERDSFTPVDCTRNLWKEMMSQVIHLLEKTSELNTAQEDFVKQLKESSPARGWKGPRCWVFPCKSQATRQSLDCEACQG